MQDSQGAPPPRFDDDLEGIVETDHQASFQQPWRRQVPSPRYRQPNDSSPLAREEEAALTSGSLEEVSKRNEHGRTEAAKAFLPRGKSAGAACGRRRNLNYEDLAEKLGKLGVEENARNLSNKIARGSFTAGFFVMCLVAVGCHHVRIHEE